MQTLEEAIGKAVAVVSVGLEAGGERSLVMQMFAFIVEL